MFGKFGRVKSVYIHKQPTAQLPPKEDSIYFLVHNKITGFKVAYIVFEFAKDLKKVFNFDSCLVFPKGNPARGLDSKYAC